jgi:nucleotide-binding universal stress UspA family protein
VNSKKKILVALDLDEQSMIALNYAEHYAQLLNFEMEVVTVIEESSLISKLFSTDEMVINMEKELEKRVDEATKAFAKKVKINIHIEHGKPYEKIAQLANETRPAFILMGRSEFAKKEISFLGSTCMHVILESGFPVITIRGYRDVEKYKRQNHEILLPLDFKKEVRKQVSAAIELAYLFKMPIHLISIQTSGGKGREAKILTQLGMTQKVIQDAGIKCSSETIFEPEKKVYELICREAVRRDSALIVIMTRAENKFSNFFMGSNALDIIHHSDIPVMSIEPWEVDTEKSMFSLISDPLNLFKK